MQGQASRARPTRIPRQLILFGLVVLLPSVVLIAVGVRSLRQEEELGERRLELARAVAVRDHSTVLFERLERRADAAAREVAVLDSPPRGVADGLLLYLGARDGTRFVPAWDSVATFDRNTQ